MMSKNNIATIIATSLDNLFHNYIKNNELLLSEFNGYKDDWEKFEFFSIIFFIQKKYIPLVWSFDKKNGWDAIYIDSKNQLCFMEAKYHSNNLNATIRKANKTIEENNPNRKHEIKNAISLLKTSMNNNDENTCKLYIDNAFGEDPFYLISKDAFLDDSLKRLDKIFGELTNPAQEPLEIKMEEKIFSIGNSSKQKDNKPVTENYQKAKEILYVKIQ